MLLSQNTSVDLAEIWLYFFPGKLRVILLTILFLVRSLVLEREWKIKNNNKKIIKKKQSENIKLSVSMYWQPKNTSEIKHWISWVVCWKFCVIGWCWYSFSCLRCADNKTWTGKLSQSHVAVSDWQSQWWWEYGLSHSRHGLRGMSFPSLFTATPACIGLENHCKTKCHWKSVTYLTLNASALRLCRQVCVCV